MHLAFRKSLATGIVTLSSSSEWDVLKYHISKLSEHDTELWDRHAVWEYFRNGFILKDTASLWRYINLETFDITDENPFKGEIIDVGESEPEYS